LDEKISTTATRFDELSKAIENLRTTLATKPGPGVEPQRFARGGNVAGPRGTDRVPAFLSDHEYVVNAASAQANGGLLDKINAARAPLYMADGGPVGDHIRRRSRVGGDYASLRPAAPSTQSDFSDIASQAATGAALGATAVPTRREFPLDARAQRIQKMI